MFFLLLHQIRQHSAVSVIFAKLITVFLIPSTFLNRFDGQEIDLELLEKFKVEAPAAWKDIRKKNLAFSKSSVGWKIEGEYRGDVLLDVKHPYNFKNRRQFLGSEFRMNLNRLDSNDETLICINRKYGFELFRKAKSTNWEIVEIIDFASQDYSRLLEDSQAFSQSFIGTLRRMPSGDGEERFIKFPDMYYADDIREDLDFFSYNNIEYRKCHWLDYQASRCVLIEIAYTTKQGVIVDGVAKVENGPAILKAIFDPKLFWALRYARGELGKSSFEGEPIYGGEVVQEFEIGLSGAPFLTSRTLTNWNAQCGKDPAKLETSQVSSNESLKATDFCLGAFGFPEPDFGQSDTYYWWCLVFAVTTLIIGFAIFRKLAGERA